MSEFHVPNEGEIDDMVESLAEWISKQPNLPHIQDEKILLRKFLINCKCRVQKAKQKIDWYYSGRTAHPDIFQNRDPTSESIETVSKLCFLFPLPNRTSQGELVFVMKADPNIAGIIPKDFLRYVTMVLDVTFQEEVNRQDYIVVADHRGFSFQHFLKLTTIIVPLIDMVLQMYPGRFKGTHSVHVPSFIGSIVAMVKKAMPSKFQDRIYVHKNMDSFYNVVDRDILPSDLGGNEKSSKELNETYREKIISYQDWFKSQDDVRSIEELRPIVSKNELRFGVEGAFRKLSFD